MNTQNSISFDYKRLPAENLNRVLAFLYGKEYDSEGDSWEQDAIVNDDKSIYNDTYLAWLWVNGFVSIEERTFHHQDGSIQKYMWAIVDDKMEFDLNHFDDGGINIYHYYYSYELDKIAYLLKEDGLNV
jgi:hypothetical protein